MNYILFEDTRWQGLRPFTLTHAAFEVRCGVYRNIDRIINLMEAGDTLTLLVRKELTAVTKERFPEYLVNPKKVDPGMWLNGACLWDTGYIELIKPWEQVMTPDGHLVAFIFESVREPGILPPLDDYHIKKLDVPYLCYLWDAIELNGDRIGTDALPHRFRNYINPAEFTMAAENGGAGRKIHPSAVLSHNYQIYLDESCEISAGVILDASKGKIIIDSGVKIDIGALIQGPVFIGRNSIINPGAKLRGNVKIGPVCKVGGEVEDSIIHGFSNKQHDGFLGHSYLGEWVNLGANTNNSDLKNNYGRIRFNFGDETVDTGLQFLGLLMGDYSKSGISTMFNTGTYAGVGANIFGGGFQPKYIRSFFWSPDSVTDFDKFIHTCQIVKNRRGFHLSDAEKTMLKGLWEGSCIG